jgi:hypothetical protein
MRLVLALAIGVVACHSWSPTNVPTPAQPLEGNPVQARVVLTDGSEVLLMSPSMSGDTLFGLKHIRGVSESVRLAIPTSQIRSLAVPTFDTLKTTGLVFGGLLIAVASFFVLIVSSYST